MEYVVIPVVAFVVSGLTFFSGFGLGTLLLPAFIAFFPAEIAVGLTAVVHALNNLFKFGLVRRGIDRGVVAWFGLPAIGAAYAGAKLLVFLAEEQVAIAYTVFSRRFETTPLNLVMGLLILFFALVEIVPRWSRVAVDGKYLWLGGLLSGFFGGLSGHQGAFRSAFLLRSGLSKDAFIASGIAIALLVDAVRLAVYGVELSDELVGSNAGLLALVIAAAFAGAYAGNKLARKTTLGAVRAIVSALLFTVAAGLLTGLLR